MKKILAVIITSVLLLSALSVSAFAFTVGDPNGIEADKFTGGSGSSDITITISGAVVNTYAVDITFGAMEFTYSTGMIWDPTEYKYVPQSGSPTWSSTSNEIEVQNHSDLEIFYNVAANITDSSYGPDVAVSVTNSVNTKVDPATVIMTPGNGPKVTSVVSIAGNPIKSGIVEQVLGTITVTISKEAA